MIGAGIIVWNKLIDADSQRGHFRTSQITASSLYRQSQQTRIPHTVVTHHSGNRHSAHMQQSQD